MSAIFPKWTNHMQTAGAVLGLGGLVAVVLAVNFLFSPNYTHAGYAPRQPVPYSHRLHAGELGMDCRYCHQGISERRPQALIPTAETCMNCHQAIKKDSPLLAPVRESAATGLSVRWVRVHELPDYVYFEHGRHVAAGVGCVSCHGRIDTMEVVRQERALSMSECLDCHRAPERQLRPLDQITNMTWQAPGDAAELGRMLRVERGLNPPEHCSACHR